MNIDELVQNGFRGCILVKKDGKTVCEKAYGYADLPNEIPIEPATKFETASAGKVFVAVGILQLIEKGQLHFNDTIGTLLNFDLKKIDPEITVEELLAHTSGIPDYFNEEVMDEYI